MPKPLPVSEVPGAPPARVGIISLGCPKNTVDTEVLLGRIAQDHVVCADPSDADVVVVNTCAFLDQAREESLAVIREVEGWKREGKIKGVVVTGCLAQRWGEELRRQEPDVDAVLGMAEYDRIGEVMRGVLDARSAAEAVQAPWRTLVAEDPSFPVEAQTGRLRITPPHYAYLQVSEGCSNACTFCSIPTFRGLFRSKTREAVLAEARELVEAGACELNIISQDTTDWGHDLPGKPGLESLLAELSELEGLAWIRLLYAYPGHVSDAMLDAMATLPKVVPYLDMPIQHISTPVLKRMGRRHTREETVELLRKLRARIPDLVLRTTFIVGFPGETEAQFQELLDFVDEFRFERLGAFPYSHEPSTPAGERFEDDVPAEVKQERLDRIMTAQQPIAFAHAESLVGQRLLVLVEGEDEEGLVLARSPYDAPEIDPLVFIHDAQGLPPGALVEVEVVRADGYDVHAELPQD
ncbi:MAG: 30S ribosomal protein S12 methylthiotransferase RimO [Planctomycetota bacterium]